METGEKTGLFIAYLSNTSLTINSLLMSNSSLVLVKRV